MGYQDGRMVWSGPVRLNTHSPFLPLTSDVTLQCSIHQTCYSKPCDNFLLPELRQSDNSIETPYVGGRINSIEINHCGEHFHFPDII